MSQTELIQAATVWMQGDVDPVTREWLRRAIQDRSEPALRSALLPPLGFGTAGLRGEVGAGPARMNLATVSQVSWGLGQFLAETYPGIVPVVVVGFDARPDSVRFARQAALVLGGCGISVLVSEDHVPTPLIAFAVRFLGVHAGVVVTASHNPRQDNGYKVFDSSGVQITAPWDTGIADLMRSAPPANELRLDGARVGALPRVVELEYLQLVRAIASAFAESSLRRPLPLTVGYTPLHGVGGSYVERALSRRDDRVRLLMPESQREPDGTFPTVPFPNPEEPGALDELLSLMKREHLTAGLANDPDADRFSLCLKRDDELVQLSGDAVGLLLAEACLRNSGPGAVVVSTAVSTPALESLVERRQGKVVRTLTGFKWLCRAAMEHESFAFAYEEALGYCFPAPRGGVSVMDKDGIAAAAVVCELLCNEGGGEALFRRLERIYDQVGQWGSFGRSVRFLVEQTNEGAVTDADAPPLNPAERLLQLLRTSPPATLAHFVVKSRLDYLVGFEQRPNYLGKSDLLQWELEAEGELDAPCFVPPPGDPRAAGLTSARLPVRGRVLIRPSGTEPKLKFYIHLCTERSNGLDHRAVDKLQEWVSDIIFLELTRGVPPVSA